MYVTATRGGSQIDNEPRNEHLCIEIVYLLRCIFKVNGGHVIYYFNIYLYFI